MAKSTVLYNLKKKECTGELSSTKRPGRLQKTTKVDDRRIQSLVKKNPFTTSSQVRPAVRTVKGAGDPGFWSPWRPCHGLWLTLKWDLIQQFTFVTDNTIYWHKYVLKLHLNLSSDMKKKTRKENKKIMVRPFQISQSRSTPLLLMLCMDVSPKKANWFLSHSRKTNILCFEKKVAICFGLK